MPNLVFQLFIIATNTLILCLGGYYILKLREKEKRLEQKENKADSEYHHVVNEALSKERKILDDATHEADQIITGANYIKQGSQELIDQAIQKIVADIQKESVSTAQIFMQRYSASLQQLSEQSVNDFKSIVSNLETDLQHEVKQFHETMLPSLQKELDEYKQARMKQTDQLASRVVQKASSEIMNKALSLDDHHDMMKEALEKAKQEGLFE